MIIDNLTLEKKTHNSEKHIFTTVSGSKVDLLDPDPDTILEYDIIFGLRKIPRYGGQLHANYSVLSHVNLCVDVYDLIKDLRNIQKLQLDDHYMRRVCFFHDASEAYIGDVPRPLKYIPEFYKIYSNIESKFDSVIYKKFAKRVPTTLEKEVIKSVDNIVLALEHETPSIRSNRKFVVSILESLEKIGFSINDLADVLDNLHDIINEFKIENLDKRHVKNNRYF
jgi:uncharacterized protein